MKPNDLHPDRNAVFELDETENTPIKEEKEVCYQEGELPPGFLEILRMEPNSQLARLFRGESDCEVEISPRAHDCAFAYALVICGFHDNEIRAVLHVNPYGQVKRGPFQHGYIVETTTIARLSFSTIRDREGA
jgi:hypothetical protein